MDKIGHWNIIRSARTMQLHRRHYLVLGLIMSLGFASASTLESSTGSSDLTASDLRLISSFVYKNWTAMLALAVGYMAAALIFSLLRHIARAGLIKSVLNNDDSVRSGLTQAWGLGLRYFGRVWLSSVLSFLLLSALALALSVPVIFLFARNSETVGLWLALLAITIFAIVALGVSYTTRFAIMYIVSSELGMLSAFEKGHLLFRKHVIASFLMSFWLTAIAGIYVLFTTLVFTLIGFAINPYLPQSFSPDNASVEWLSAWISWSAIVGIIQALIFAPLMTLIETSWTLLFRVLAGNHASETDIAKEAAKFSDDRDELLSPVKTDEIVSRVDNSSRN